MLAGFLLSWITAWFCSYLFPSFNTEYSISVFSLPAAFSLFTVSILSWKRFSNNGCPILRRLCLSGFEAGFHLSRRKCPVTSPNTNSLQNWTYSDLTCKPGNQSKARLGHQRKTKTQGQIHSNLPKFMFYSPITEKCSVRVYKYYKYMSETPSDSYHSAVGIETLRWVLQTQIWIRPYPKMQGAQRLMGKIDTYTNNHNLILEMQSECRKVLIFLLFQHKGEKSFSMIKWRGHVFNGSTDRTSVPGSLLTTRDYLRSLPKATAMVERIWKQRVEHIKLWAPGQYLNKSEILSLFQRIQSILE